MSAQIVKFTEFKERIEKRPEDFPALFARLREAYPDLSVRECEWAVETWHQEKRDRKKRLWADNDIFCLLKCPHWQTQIAVAQASFIELGIVFRAAWVSGRCLPIALAIREDDEDEVFVVWHTTSWGLIHAETYLDDEFLEDFEDDAEERECITDWPHLFASDRMGYLREAARSLDNELSAEAVERIEKTRL
jgi:hypothetical protein